MVSDDSSVDEASKIQPLCSKLRHDDEVATSDQIDATLDRHRAVKDLLLCDAQMRVRLIATLKEATLANGFPSTANHYHCSSYVSAT